MTLVRTQRGYQCEHGFGRCVHRTCYYAALRRAGKERAAARLQRNAEVLDWAQNWGKMLYDQARDERCKASTTGRRRALARIMRMMRSGEFSYSDATVCATWAGALMP